MDTLDNHHFKKRSIWDNLLVGIMAGLLLTLISMPIMAYVNSPSGASLTKFLNRVFMNKDLTSSLISLSVLPNLLLFFAFYKLKYDKASKGVILISVIFCLIVFILKLI